MAKVGMQQSSDKTGYTQLQEIPSGHGGHHYGISRAELADIVNQLQQRTFCEDVDSLEKLGGAEAIVKKLATNHQTGISPSEVAERTESFGSNKKKEKPLSSFWKLLKEALEDNTLRILMVSSVVSICIDMYTAEPEHRSTAWIEGFAIFVAVMICSTVTAGNNYRQERQFRTLFDEANKRKLASVIRGGKLMALGADDLVVGDLVKLTEGMEIPADGFLLDAKEVTTDESAMTGETDPIKKATLRDCLAKKKQVTLEHKDLSKAGHHAVPSPLILSGTRVLTGEGDFLVVVVGELSCVGRIQEKLNQDSEPTPLQQKLEAIADDIGKFGLAAAILTVLAMLTRIIIDIVQKGWDSEESLASILRAFILGITVVVVAIPEGLPLAVTLSLAYSVKKMLADQNLVRKIEACETMGGAQYICSDKTGTLTQNKMTLVTMWNDEPVQIKVYEENQKISAYFPETIQEYCVDGLCNSSATLDPLSGSKTEIAFLQFLQKCSINPEQHRASLKVIDKYPFSSQRKRMSTILDKNGVARMHIKGASELVLESCSKYHSWKTNRIVDMTPELRHKIEKAIEDMANSALRTICIAYKDLNGREDRATKDEKNVFELEKSGFTCLGIFGIKDVLREEVKPAIQQCHKAGITVKMVTGDNKMTARAIAKEAGIADEQSLVLEGLEFMNKIGGVVCSLCKERDCPCPTDAEEAEKTGKAVRVDTIKNASAFDEIYKNLAVLARSRPEDKYAMVTGLRERGYVVAVTGDGTNDAPALKKADVGFAMGIAGTEVAREASSIILLDDNFNSIVKAVMWGRNIYDSIRKFIQFQLTVNIVAVCITFLGALLITQAILGAIQMLWVNLIMDTLASLALATEPPTEELLNRQPHNRKDYIVSKRMFKHIIGQAVYQLFIILTLVFAGDMFIPESNVKYENPDRPGIIFNGREHYINGDRGLNKDSSICKLHPDRGYDCAEALGPSRHFTVVFATFVWLQIFNFLNARKLNDELWVLGNITHSPLFIGIVIFIAAAQFLITQFGFLVFDCHKDGLTATQWGIAIALGSGGLIWSVVLKIMTAACCPQFGNEESASSTLLNIKKPSHRKSIKGGIMPSLVTSAATQQGIQIVKK